MKKIILILSLLFFGLISYSQLNHNPVESFDSTMSYSKFKHKIINCDYEIQTQSPILLPKKKNDDNSKKLALGACAALVTITSIEHFANDQKTFGNMYYVINGVAIVSTIIFVSTR